MKRPILVAMIGYIIGIIGANYFSFSIALFYLPMIALVYGIRKRIGKKHRFKLISFSRYFRYIKLVITPKVIFIIFVISLFSNSIVLVENQKYNTMREELQKKETVSLTGIVISDPVDQDYQKRYQIKIVVPGKYQGYCFYITVNKNNKTPIFYGDEISITGSYQNPMGKRNQGGFDLQNVYKQKKMIGTIKTTHIEVIASQKINTISLEIHKLQAKLKQKIQQVLPQDSSSLFLGLFLGDTSQLEETLQENFRNASMAHILAVSGMHISYLLLGMQLLLGKTVGKRKLKMISILGILMYLGITGGTASMVRASIMGILMLGAGLCYRKNDMLTSFSVSLLVILLQNPFSLMSLGLQLSYGGTLGIIFFQKIIFQLLENRLIYYVKKRKKIIVRKMRRLIQKGLSFLSVCFSVQMVIFPIIMFHFNTIHPYFLITNLGISIVLPVIMILGFVFLLVLLFPIPFLISIFQWSITTGISLLVFISQLANLPFTKMYVPTPSIFNILLYGISICILFFISSCYLTHQPNMTQIRVKNLIALFRYRLKQLGKTKKRGIFISCIILMITFSFIPQDLEIHFIDVGQGDSILIETPKGKTILIDGGGSLSEQFDVGKNIVLPFLLDRGHTHIDLIMISHFDQDHCRTGCLLS